MAEIWIWLQADQLEELPKPPESLALSVRDSFQHASQIFRGTVVR